MTKESFAVSEAPGQLIVTAQGHTGSELFAATSAAYFSSVCALSDVKARQAYELDRQADSVEELLVGWLNDLIWVFSEQEVVCTEVQFSHWSPTSYRVTLLGEALDEARHAPRDVVVAASSDGLELEASEGHWTARVILLT